MTTKASKQLGLAGALLSLATASVMAFPAAAQANPGGGAGRMYGDPAERIAVDVERALAFPGQGIRLLMGERDAPLAVGCALLDGQMAGLYGLHTAEAARGCGHATQLVASLLKRAMLAGAQRACLQVGAGNDGARRLYQRLGFADRYAYWYRAREIE